MWGWGFANMLTFAFMHHSYLVGMLLAWHPYIFLLFLFSCSILYEPYKVVYITNHTTLDLGHWKFAVRYTLTFGSGYIYCKPSLTLVSGSIFAICVNNLPSLSYNHKPQHCDPQNICEGVFTNALQSCSKKLSRFECKQVVVVTIEVVRWSGQLPLWLSCAISLH